VSDGGVIHLPMLTEPIRAAGLMPAELEKSIAEAVGVVILSASGQSSASDPEEMTDRRASVQQRRFGKCN